REVAGSGLFREALLWQNRAGFHTGAKLLLQAPVTDRSSSVRSKERYVASHIQRYCAKNDSIGFFGPVAWGEFRESGAPLVCRPGPELLWDRRTFLEHWALDALCARISEVPGIQPWLAPRRMPYVRVEGTRLFTPLGADELSPLRARVLAGCGGDETARALALRLKEDASAGVEREEAVYVELTELASQGLILWRMEVPTVGRTRFMQVVRQQLERIGDPAVREQAQALFKELEGAHDAVVRAAGDAAALDAALQVMEETFTRLTGSAPYRNAGQLYAGRTLIYEDCRRDVSVDLGPQVRERLAPALSLLLMAGRWLTFHQARAYRGVFDSLFEALCREGGTDTLELSQFWAHAIRHIPRGHGTFPAEVMAVLTEFQCRWAQVLGLPFEGRRLELFAQELLPKVQEAFAAPGPGWPTARYHSPDILLAASSTEDVARGDYALVLGELHIGMNTLEQELFFDDHREPELLLQWMTEDMQRGRVYPAVPKHIASSRTGFGISEHPDDATIEFDAARSSRPREQTVAIADCVVRRVDGRVTVCSRDGRRQWDIIAFADMLLSNARAGLLGSARHIPRITIDGLVVWRESWSFTPQELAFAERKTPLERFMGARELARAYGLPRFMFVKASAEAKPCYLDLWSPLYVELLAHLVRRSTSITLSEMLPGAEACWLQDAQGQSYTSEIRIVAVDPLHWAPAAPSAMDRPTPV
ncbi:lantibiotic dehydratase, partial [Myxococcus vastator]|uniref:lantibiotic dehydratase n=1 Tax=Myxococcus vastator TaxID=2709664 RepID=UPI0013D28064